MHCQPKWRNLVDSVGHAVQRLLWPPLCLVCGGAGHGARDLCSGCEQDVVPLGPACVRCAQPLPAVAGSEAVCGQCLRRPPKFHRSLCALRYEAPVDQLIRLFKYRRDLAAGRLLAQLFCQHGGRAAARRPDCLIPVPLGVRRYRERGFNQAIELGAPIARHLGIPLRADIVVRVRDTAEQVGLVPRERRRNVRRAFAVVEPVEVRHVAILDDVMTTGSTINEVARVLRAAGVREVEAWAIARAGAVHG